MVASIKKHQLVLIQAYRARTQLTLERQVAVSPSRNGTLSGCLMREKGVKRLRQAVAQVLDSQQFDCQVIFSLNVPRLLEAEA